DARGGEPRARGLAPLDVTPGQEDLASASDADDEPGDRRVLLTEGHDQVADLSEPPAVSVEDRLPDHLAEEHGTTTSIRDVGGTRTGGRGSRRTAVTCARRPSSRT